MGRKEFFAERDEITKERRRLQRERNGYVPGARRQEDSIREKDKRLAETNNLHRQNVDLWLNFTADPENGFEYYKTSFGCPAPSHEMIKEFIRWYISSTEGRLNENGRPTVRTVQACAERFFGGFEELTKTKIIPDDRKEIKSWIKKTLTAEGTIVNQKKEKLNFTRHDFLRTVSSLWQTDHQTFIPGLLKVVILFALQLYLFTGARVGSFIPSSKDKHERGLRYKHIDLVLFPSTTAPWAVGWRVKQVWLKNNRCPQYTVFGIGIRDSNRPQFASGYLLLSLALAHGALFRVNTVDDLAQFDLSNGEIPLRWKDEYLEKPVLRHATADGPQETPLTKQKFCSCLRQIFAAAGYFGELATIHCIRRNLGKKVEKRHGSAPVSQIMAHQGPGTFPEHYQAHCSSMDTVSAVLDEADQSDHIEYFQGYVQFYERGLPSELPAEVKKSILEKPDMVRMRDRIDLFERGHDANSLKHEQLEYRKALVRHRLSELKQYQNRWVREKRDQKIINRGKEEPRHLENDICTRAQMLIMPEVARIATAMSCTKELSFDEKLLFVQDLQTQDNAHRSCVQAVIPPNSLTTPPEECETTRISASGMSQPHPPVSGFANQPVGYCAVTEATEKRKDLQECLTSLSNCDQAATTDSNADSHSLARAEGGEQNLPCDDQVPPSSPCRPLARAKAQTQSPQHHADGLSSCKPRQRLDAKSKRKLRDLQKKKLTLRQIGPHFADVDMALLRQAWMELKLSQRCTRSRAN
ncbi:hypothetical protein DTO013E5_5321 [Penicillium roqueforti]|nr:hypothetical protein DTO012A1_4461 [Penicillium roqueforti]KAI2744187.1 hypothetical protein DTO013F2_8008 [Penicillium roqueforti]KAI2767682.1 hypothetical protein DTO012A8_7076 [Penicillium roqueforti]KAI3210254.1 hypothetical protein DTO013E5_5321 [Penicillium roqueforti]